MSIPTQKGKKALSKLSKSRPTATSSISQPTVEDAWASASLSAFSRDAQHFAVVSLAVDKHRLRIYNVNSNKVVYENTIERSRVASLAWISVNLAASSEEKERTSSKKRRTQEGEKVTENGEADSRAEPEELVALGLEDGSILIHSSRQGRVVRTLALSSSKAAVLAVAQDFSGDGNNLWSSGADSTLRLWDVPTGACLSQVDRAGKSAYSALSLGSTDSGSSLLLAGSTKIDMFAISSDAKSSSEEGSDELELRCSFNGHATLVKSLKWDTTSAPNMRFVSAAEDDRLVYLWEIQQQSSQKGKMVASIPLDATARQVELASPLDQLLLATLSTSGQITLSPIPKELFATGSKSTKQVPTIRPRTIISLTSKASAGKAYVSAFTFVPSQSQTLVMAITDGGAKMAFETVTFVTEDGGFVPEVTVKPSFNRTVDADASSSSVKASKRYNESAGLAVASGSDMPHDPTLDAAAENTIDGALDADLAEMSLGERLAARSGSNRKAADGQLSDAEEGQESGTRKRKSRAPTTTIPSHSLTRTLIQALHAGDTSLLEACLTHSDEALIKNTVARLPPQLAVPLLSACVERLGRGARGNGIKGRGGGASAQRGMALVKWVRAVLTIHSAHLMTMPDLVARLSHLYSTLTTRLTLQDRLLSLSGKLDLVLSQAELRSSHTPAPLGTKSKEDKGPQAEARKPTKYVEGESSEEEDQVQIEADDDDEDGSVENIELGDDETDEDDEDDEDVDSEDSEGNLANGFIDDEAEEDYDEDESDDESE